nr:beta-1,4-N-acetylgalactosaminyltransferase 3-like [Paramormyrops kingsleyae]
MYIDETDLKLHEVSHIPQTPASSFHWRTYARVSSHGAEMLREDPRDSFYHVPLMSASNLRGILPVCPYSPTYLIKGYPLQRYQGIEFVSMTLVSDCQGVMALVEVSVLFKQWVGCSDICSS